MNNRRKLVIALGAGALTAPLTSFAQAQGKVWCVGFLSQQRLESFNYGAFQQGMRELGYVEGKNVRYEARYMAGKFERLPEVAAELMKLNADTIVVGGGAPTLGVKAATRTIPIVMVGVADPVGAGLVTSLARPGGNVTGISSISGETGVKRLDLLISAIPNLSRVAVFFNPANAGYEIPLKPIQAAAKKAGVHLMPFGVRTWEEIEKTFSVMGTQRVQALLIMSGGLFGTYRRQLAQLAATRRLPSIHEAEPYAEFGGLMSYGYSVAESFRRAAVFVDKIFKGAKPADLPVEQPTTFNLVINMKTASALGIKFPNSILVRATKVIE
jgi:putative ABC transport system substrate-binding protein